MKNTLQSFTIFLISIIISMIFYFDFTEVVASSEMDWTYKKKETNSRLISVPILLYHNIDGSGPFSIEYEKIKSHFQLIKDRKIKVISLSKLMEQLENPYLYRKKGIVITFDDGYLSMYTKLLLLQKEFKYPITLFVYTDVIESRSRKRLTWKKLREMEKHGIDIQAHTKSHKDLTKFTNSNDIEFKRKLFEEIYLSKKVIELYLGKKINFFALPYGKYDLQILDLSYYSDYKKIFSTDYGSNILTRNNYCLKRQHIKSDFSIQFIDKLIR